MAYSLYSVLISAYIVLIYSKPNYFRLHRFGGQLLYFKALSIGSIFLGVAYFINIYIPIINYICNFLPNTHFPNINNKELEESIVFFSLPIIFSLLYCFSYLLFRLTIIWWNIPSDKLKNISFLETDKLLLMYKILKDSPLDNLLYQSYMDEKFLIITMSDRKVYIGRINCLAEPTENKAANQEISIVPILSGYRDKDTLRVHLLNNYAEMSKKHALSIVLKQTEITSAAEFNEEVHRELSNVSKEKQIAKTTRPRYKKPTRKDAE